MYPFFTRKPIKYLLLTLLIIIIGLAIGIWQWLLVNLPHPDELYQHTSAPSTNIYDRHGTLLYQITDPHQGYHTPLTLAEIPQTCQQATIATEDATFYSNPGFDTWAMLRALLTNVQEGQVVSGASTITQQLARNLLFTQDERTEISITRKLREVILAWRLTQTYTKDEILRLYLNETYYGNLAYGLEAASNTYFGKHAAELDLAECSLLAGLPQSPMYYNPLHNLPVAEARQGDVLGLMVKHGFLTEDEAALAEHEKLQFAAIPFPIEAPHFVMYIREQLEQQFGLEAIYTQGLQVHTTLDLNMQYTTQQIARYHLNELNNPIDQIFDHNVHNAAVTVLTPNTGEVLVMLGSPDYFNREIDGNVNVAIAERQPGSAIKPITYAAAFDPQIAAEYGYKPLTPASMMMDVRTAFVTHEGEPYVPQNYDRQWHGPVLLRQALASSFNLVAVKVLDHIGVEAMTHLARRTGINTFDSMNNLGLALTLGGGEVRLLELTGAYAALANGGFKVEPVSILKISNAQGEVLYKSRLDWDERVLSEQAAYLITDILSDNLARAGAFGMGSYLKLSRPAAAKTGTTTDFRDNWTMGYTPNFVTGVWVGNADNEPMRYVTGISGAAPIWYDVMEAIHEDLPIRHFQQPPGLVTQTVCGLNGLLPSEGCQHTLNELFIVGTEPTQTDTWHKYLKIDRRNGLLASPTCPAEYTIARWFTIYPFEAQTWVEKNPTRQVPTSYSPLCPTTEETYTQESLTDWPVSYISSSDSPFKKSPIHFLSPDQGATYKLSTAIPAVEQQIAIAVQTSADIDPHSVQLYVNGTFLQEGHQTLWQLSPGHYQFEAIATKRNGEAVRNSVEIEVR